MPSSRPVLSLRPVWANSPRLIFHCIFCLKNRHAFKCVHIAAEINAAVLGADIDPFYGAPDVVVVLADKSMPTYVYDGSLVMGNMMNAAADLGVASCWVHRAKEEFESEEGKAILKKLGIEGEYEGIGNLILGYAAKPTGEAAPRKANYVYSI